MGMPITTTSGSIPAIFNGSATVTSVQTGTSSPGSIVATSQEFDLGATSYKAYAFNGVSGGATKLIALGILQLLRSPGDLRHYHQLLCINERERCQY